MKNKIFAIIIAILIFIIISMASIFLIKTYKTQIPQKQEETSVDWKALYIWDESVDLNEYLCFRKNIKIEDVNDLNNSLAFIAVDSKYWLYINDKLVVHEGGLKRGRTSSSIYYDKVNISKYLKEGNNTIAILAWHWGKDSYSHNSYAHKGLLFQAQIGDKVIISDESWKVSSHEAFLRENVYSPNYRLAEYNVLYDARLEKENWYKQDFNDTNWENAKIVEADGCELIERDIPFFKNSDLKEYSNMKEYTNYVTEKDETIEMNLPYSMQFMPYLKIEAEAGKIIRITTDTYMIDEEKSLSHSYITKDGIQEYEAYNWISGDKAYYEIPQGIKIISLGYRETGYDSELSGNFECDDEFLNKLWKKAQRTLYINMRDSYMDCPDRERTQWSLDMNLEMEQALYSLDTKANALYEHGIRTIIGWKKDDALLTVVPNTHEPIQLPVQTLLTINGMYEYYLYTGNTSFLEEIYPHIESYLNLWQMNVYNVLEYTSNYYVWEWTDGSDTSDYKLLEIMSYYFAKDSLCKMAKALNYTDNVAKLQADLRDIEYFLEAHWTEDGYKSTSEEKANCRVNALAVISGLAKEDRYPIITKVLTKDYDTGPAMEKYILEALCIMGENESATERIKERYEKMVNSDKSTLWEHWGEELGGKNHAWSGGPLTIMSKYYAGISPLTAGYEKILIKPNFKSINKISSQVSSVKGNINLKCEKTDESISIELETPSETLLGIPKEFENQTIQINELTVYEKGKAKANYKYEYNKEDNEYIYFTIPKGKYIIDCKIK